MSILDKFKNERHIVGVSLTPGIGLEAVVLDKTKKQVLKYGKKDVSYNFSTREIQNTSQFKAQFSELMDALDIPPKAEINLVLPNILFDFIEAPAELTDDDVKTMILTKAEEFYLFKREEPISGYCEVINFNGGTNKKFAYTSFQKNIVEQIKEIITTELGFNLISIESSYSATLRGLFVAGLIDDVVLESASWTFMLVNSNSYTLFQMEGKNIVSYNDVPLAIKSFSVDEAYQAIIQGASQLLVNYISSKLYIASQTDEISADYLKKHMQFDRDIVVIESNKFAENPIMEIAMPTDKKANAMTLTCIGAASGRVDFSFALNVLQDDPTIKSDVYRLNLGGKEYELLGAQIDAYSILACILIGIVGFALVGIVFTTNTMNDRKSEELTQKIADLDAKITELSKVEKKEEVDVESIIDEVAETNVQTINFYDSISTDIPKNVWLTKYYNKSGRDIAIKGIAESIIDIYEYYKNLRVISPQSDIKLNELRVVTSDEKSEEVDKFISSLNINQDKDRLYSFEISNTQIQLPTESNTIDENNLLRQAPSAPVEETSSQMTPAN